MVLRLAICLRVEMSTEIYICFSYSAENIKKETQYKLSRKQSMAKVFVSYSRKDTEFAKRLTGELQKDDMDLWIDWEDIPPTVDWRKQIEKGIEEADAFLFLISPDSAKSKVCGLEIDCAVKNGKRIIPIVVREIEWEDTPPHLGHLNYIFFSRDDDFDTAVKKLLTAIHTDYEWMQTHRRLQVKALEWERNNHENSFLLRGKDLQDAEFQHATNSSKEPYPTDLQRDYVFKSRQAADRQRRITRIISVVVIIALVALAVVGLVQARLATASRNDAQAASTLAVSNASTAQAASTLAVSNEQKAITQANIALARQLAAQAQSINANRSSKQMTAVLLAIQSIKLFPNVDATSFLINNNLSAQPIATITHDDFVSVVAFSPDGNFVVSGSFDTTARVWEVSTGKEISRMTHNDSVSTVAFSPDGKYVVSRSLDSTARVWEAATGKEVARMTHDGQVTAVAFSPDGKYVVSGSYDTTARVWEAATGNEVARTGHDDGVNSVSFSPDGKYVASGGWDGTTQVWEASTGKEVVRMKHDDVVISVVFSPDGKYVVSGGYDNTARVWEASTGKEIAYMTHDGSVNSVAFSPDGKYVVSGSRDGTARVWETSTGKEVARITYDDYVTSIAFSPDGKYVVSGGDITARVWEVSTGKEITRLTHDGSVNSVAFSPDRQYVVSGSNDNTARMWIWQPEDLIDEACSRVARNLTRAEWSQYIGDALPYQVICPNLPLDLEYFNVIAKDILSNANDSNQVKTALDKVQAELINDNIKDPIAEAHSIVSVATAEQISTESAAGNIEKALSLFDQAHRARLSIDEANSLNNLCWFGSLQGYEKQVLEYCETAVKLAPDDAAIRDSRGLARALTGDYQGAILDFQYYVDNNSADSDTIQQRNQWVEQLKKGINPFTSDVLESLKSQ